MKKEIFEKSLDRAILERNLLIITTICLSFSICILGGFLFMKSNRVVVVPPIVEKSFWIDGNHVSPSYIEQFGVFIADLLLTKSMQSFSTKRNIVLRHTDPIFTDQLRKKLYEEEALLKKQNASYVFHPKSVKVNPDEMSFIIGGERLIYINGNATSNKKENYKLQFSSSGGRLLLSSITFKEGES